MKINFLQRSKLAGVELAQAAITSPGVFPVYCRWHDALQELEKAKANLEVAAERWQAFIAPALDDPDYQRIAEKRGLIPDRPMRKA